MCSLLPYKNHSQYNHKCNINGKILTYDAAASNENAYDINIFEFIGYGSFHSVDQLGKTYPLSGIAYFFKRIKN